MGPLRLEGSTPRLFVPSSLRSVRRTAKREKEKAWRAAAPAASSALAPEEATRRALVLRAVSGARASRTTTSCPPASSPPSPFPSPGRVMPVQSPPGEKRNKSASKRHARRGPGLMSVGRARAQRRVPVRRCLRCITYVVYTYRYKRRRCRCRGKALYIHIRVQPATGTATRRRGRM